MTWEVTDPKITPPHMSDPDTGDVQPWEPGREDADDSSVVEQVTKDTDWDLLAKDAFRDSTSYVDTNYRNRWEDSLKAFNNKHPGDSKYNLETFRKRSHTFVPKTRAVIRKNEAAAAAAFFSNLDTVSIQANNQSDEKQRISADVMQGLIQYRLTHTIPWFLVLIGAIQDAQTQGACIAHIHWRFVARTKEGTLDIVEDRPVIDLRPIENIRFHPAADWMDPLHTSPYLIDMIPMYVGDVKERMNHPDPKGRTWHTCDDDTFRRYTDTDVDSTRQARLQAAEDPTTARSRVSDYDVVWVHRHIHRVKGKDYEWYTIASEKRLTDPEPLKRTVFHGRRPYEMGRAILETHKALPASVPELVRGLQDDLNDTRNQRHDNVKFVLNKRYIVKRGANVDTASLVRNVPGGITFANNVDGEIKEQEWQDVTQSAYLEEDRITGNFDEIAGNFNPMQVAQQRTPRESERTMLALQSPSNLLTEYLLKTFVETFVVPSLRQLVLLEQHYETDQAVLAIAGQKAQVYQKFGIDQVTDDLLNAELTTNVNVGMGATDPEQKLQRFLGGVSNLAKIAVRPPPGINLTEVYKEVFALSGYQDGTRFLTGQNPEVVRLQQQLQQLQKLYKDKVGDKHEKNVLDFRAKRDTNLVKLATQEKQHRHEKVLTLVQHLMGMDSQNAQAAQAQAAENETNAPTGT